MTTLTNVFADLRCEQPAALLLKANLMVVMLHEIALQGWSRDELTSRLSISLDRVGQLLQHDFNGFSLNEVVEMAAAIGVRTKVLKAPRSS